MLQTDLRCQSHEYEYFWTENNLDVKRWTEIDRKHSKGRLANGLFFRIPFGIWIIVIEQQ